MVILCPSPPWRSRANVVHLWVLHISHRAVLSLLQRALARFWYLFEPETLLALSVIATKPFDVKCAKPTKWTTFARDLYAVEPRDSLS